MRVLVVSIAFPPKNDPECLQTARIFKYLAQHTSLQLDVVTSKTPTLFMPVDETLRKYDSGYHQKIEIPIYENKLTNFIIRKVGAGNLLFPDSKMTFHWQWKEVIASIKERPDLIYSRSNPISSAFMALKLKKHFNVPWVMHFSDPWIMSSAEMNDPRTIKAEKELMTTADVITFTTEETVLLYSRRYPDASHKFRVIPNVFDPEEISVDAHTPTDKLRIVYTGGLAGDRSLYFLNDVLQYISDANQGVLDYLDIIVAGPMDRYNAAFFSSTPFRCVRHVGMLSYEAARSLQRSADILLVVDNPKHVSDSVFFPSKLLDYFVSGKIILACTPVGSTTRRILADYHSESFHIGELRQMADFIKGRIEQFRSGEKPVTVDKPPFQYSASENASRLVELFQSVLQSI